MFIHSFAMFCCVFLCELRGPAWSVHVAFSQTFPKKHPTKCHEQRCRGMGDGIGGQKSSFHLGSVRLRRRRRLLFRLLCCAVSDADRSLHRSLWRCRIRASKDFSPISSCLTPPNGRCRRRRRRLCISFHPSLLSSLLRRSPRASFFCNLEVSSPA